jgi:hypothetical protein
MTQLRHARQKWLFLFVFGGVGLFSSSSYLLLYPHLGCHLLLLVRIQGISEERIQHDSC